jgi:hypothetical protein
VKSVQKKQKLSPTDRLRPTDKTSVGLNLSVGAIFQNLFGSDLYVLGSFKMISPIRRFAGAILT